MDIEKRTKALSVLSQTQKERLSHIDFRLMYLGVIQRNDLIQRFGTKEAAATRDIALYRKLAPDNIIYNTKERSYFYNPQFVPLFDYISERALAALSNGFGDDYVGLQSMAILSCETPAQLNITQLDTLSVLTRAIHQHQVVAINYFSLSSGVSSREIVPFALVDNGLRCHIRAYDRKRERFTDFVINRIENPKIIESIAKEHESKEADNQWNRIVELEFVPHPALKHPESISMDYGMHKRGMKKTGMQKNNTQGDLLNVNVRAAVAGYFLRRWNIDCSQSHSLKGDEYHLWLKNYPALYGVDNLLIAPGYQKP